MALSTLLRTPGKKSREVIVVLLLHNSNLLSRAFTPYFSSTALHVK